MSRPAGTVVPPSGCGRVAKTLRVGLPLMRALLATVLLLSAAAPAAATHLQTLTLSDLLITFDPLTQAAVYEFDLANDATTPTGALYANVAAHGENLTRAGIRLDGSGIAAGQSKHLVLSVPNSFAVNGCIAAYGTTAPGGYSNRECAMMRGATQAPVPDVEAPDVPGPEDVPPAPEPEAPELPAPPTTLP